MLQVARVYKDKLADAKDIDLFDKSLREILKKTFDDIFKESSTLKAPLIYCHFAKGIGEPKYMPVTSWDSLLKILMDALKVRVSYYIVRNNGVQLSTFYIFTQPRCHQLNNVYVKQAIHDH